MEITAASREKTARPRTSGRRQASFDCRCNSRRRSLQPESSDGSHDRDSSHRASGVENDVRHRWVPIPGEHLNHLGQRGQPRSCKDRGPAGPSRQLTHKTERYVVAEVQHQIAPSVGATTKGDDVDPALMAQRNAAPRETERSPTSQPGSSAEFQEPPSCRSSSTGVWTRHETNQTNLAGPREAGLRVSGNFSPFVGVYRLPCRRCCRADIVQ